MSKVDTYSEKTLDGRWSGMVWASATFCLSEQISSSACGAAVRPGDVRLLQGSSWYPPRTICGLWWCFPVGHWRCWPVDQSSCCPASEHWSCCPEEYILVKSDLKKSPICPITSQSDQLWAKIWHHLHIYVDINISRSTDLPSASTMDIKDK